MCCPSSENLLWNETKSMIRSSVTTFEGFFSSFSLFAVSFHGMSWWVPREHVSLQEGTCTDRKHAISFSLILYYSSPSHESETFFLAERILGRTNPVSEWGWKSPFRHWWAYFFAQIYFFFSLMWSILKVFKFDETFFIKSRHILFQNALIYLIKCKFSHKHKGILKIPVTH